MIQTIHFHVVSPNTFITTISIISPAVPVSTLYTSQQVSSKLPK